MKLIDFINSLAAKCGKQNEQAIIDILSRADLQNIDLEDSVANAINNGLLTVDAAKNNLTVKNHFNALALGSVDSEVLNMVRKLELGEEFETEIMETKNTFEKHRKLAEKLKESIEASKTQNGKPDEKAIEKYTKQISDLNAKIAQLKETTVPKTELERVQKESENSTRDYMLHSKLSALDFSNKDMEKEANIEVANVLLNRALAKNKAVIVKEGNELKLRNADDNNLYYFDEQNKQVVFDDFMNKVFAENKILAVSGTKPNTPPANPVNPVITYQPAQGQLNTSKFDEAMNRALYGEQN